ncbi:hypothetical protein ACN6J9_13550 [Carnobacterium maltaromaticum]|uniref:hypothetical protein n=1 Tax=Carnobacterium maltaromaticum TaxID=2751 RepID=UPI000704BDA9|nr:hypothetical protein [Carnobacterium maltaromaticum]KRN73601.1 hypothetical protein IV76_GL001318 [Carnobacterium maltaromaticum]MBC9809528.1 hypothetical protein [Carnobacterium maltaromaticum]CRH17541.1 conserved membrane hypothetical protein [Carnobacterium maltaromaticum]CRH21174.1 conserved membrane hypothetical protein [Carnobacterium maltaromaticum]
MKRTIKIISIILTAMILVNAFLFSPIVVNASEAETIQETIDLEYYKNSPYFSVSSDGNNFEIELTRSGLIQYCKDNNLPLPAPDLARAAGTTKIVGSVFSGTFKIYIKKSDLNFLANRGGAGVSLIFGSLPGFVLSSIIAYIAPGNYSHGRVFVYQNYSYQYWYYQ